MGETLTLQEMNDQLSLRQVRLLQVIDNMRAVFRADLPLFVMREAKQAFLGEPKVTGDWPTSKVSAFKKGAEALGRALVEEVEGLLAEKGAWDVGVLGNGERQDLNGVPGVVKALAKLEKKLGAYLEESGLASDVHYKLPAYFVEGHYMPALVEHFWRIVSESLELEAEKAATIKRQEREQLQAKWDEAD